MQNRGKKGDRTYRGHEKGDVEIRSLPFDNTKAAETELQWFSETAQRHSIPYIWKEVQSSPVMESSAEI